MADRFDRLRHDAVVGRDHQHHEISDFGAARAHRGERGVARRIEESDLRARRQLHLIGADMLGDAAGFARDHIGLAQRIEQRGLAVIDVAHDGDDGRTRRQITAFVLGALQAFEHVGFGNAAHLVTEFGRHQFRGCRRRSRRTISPSSPISSGS